MKVYLFLAAFSVAAAFDEEARDVAVLPLGDSITENDHYRYALWKMLIDDGHNVNMMGTRNKVNGKRPVHKGKAFDADHEGYWGISAEWLYKKPLADRLEEIKKKNGGRLVDFALYHIGTNDINTKDRSRGEKYVTKTVVPHIERTIDALRAHNPDITILLCKIIPISNNQTVRMSLVDYINDNHIDAIQKRKDTPRSRVIVVDQNTGFDATRGKDTYDGMHPNDRGGEKMAAKFYASMKHYWASRDAKRSSGRDKD